MKPLLSLTLIASLSAALPATAQGVNEADLAALRYFISIGDQDSIAAETRRLEVQFPGVDIAATIGDMTGKPPVDDSPVWALIDADDYAGAHAKIDEIRGAEPDWEPTEHLVEILRQREGQATLELALADGDLGAVLGAAQSFPELLTCERINNPWRIADLYVAEDQKAGAREVYRGILKTCSETDFVIATLQKSTVVNDAEQMGAMFRVAAARHPGLADRLAILQTELMAGITARDAPEQGAPAMSRTAGDPRLSQAKAAADRSDWASCLSITEGAGSTALVFQRSWCALNGGRPSEALAGFERTAGASGSSSMRRDARFGMILAQLRLGQHEAAAERLAQGGLTASQRATVETALLGKQAQASFENRRYGDAIRYLDRLRDRTGQLDRGSAMLRGWALLKLGRRGDAITQFRAIHTANPGNDSRHALITAQKL